MCDVSLPRTLFIDRKVKEGVKPEQIRKDHEFNGFVDIVIKEKDGLHVISHEKLDLNELGKAKPNLNIDELKQYDENNDGFLVENEIKVSIKEALNRGLILTWGTTLGTGVVCAGIGSVVAPVMGTALGFAGGVVIGFSMGFYAGMDETTNSLGTYQASMWNADSNIKTIR